VTFYVQIESVKPGFMIDAESVEDALKQAKQRAISAIEDDLQIGNLWCEIVLSRRAERQAGPASDPALNGSL
jgi:hypothetical protein